MHGMHRVRVGVARSAAFSRCFELPVRVERVVVNELAAVVGAVLRVLAREEDVGMPHLISVGAGTDAAVRIQPAFPHEHAIRMFGSGQAFGTPVRIFFCHPRHLAREDEGGQSGQRGPSGRLRLHRSLLDLVHDEPPQTDGNHFPTKGVCHLFIFCQIFYFLCRLYRRTQ